MASLRLRKGIFARLVRSEPLWRFIKFGIVGGVGTILNLFLEWVFHGAFGLEQWLAVVLSTEAAIISNFIGNHNFTFKDRKGGTSLPKQFLTFQTISLVTVFGTTAIVLAFNHFIGETRIGIPGTAISLNLWLAIAILVMFLANFVLNSMFTWRQHASTPTRKKQRRSR